MALTVAAPKKRNNIIEKYLATLSEEDRQQDLEYLTRPDMYSHVELAKALSKELGYPVTTSAVRGWRQRHL